MSATRADIIHPFSLWPRTSDRAIVREFEFGWVVYRRRADETVYADSTFPISHKVQADAYAAQINAGGAR
jgi:hypothetical protein